MKIFANGFWSEFTRGDKSPFINILSSCFNQPIEFSSYNDSDILLESVFGPRTFVNDPKWKYTFLFIGEPNRRFPNLGSSNRLPSTFSMYSCILKGDTSRDNIICFPHFYYTLLSRVDRFNEVLTYTTTNIPTKDVCVIVSNNDNRFRSHVFDRIEHSGIRIDYAGGYKTNVPKLHADFCTLEFIHFVSKYKFIVALENTNEEEYITEKILHGLLSKTIPIYWGTRNAFKYFNNARMLYIEDETDDAITATIDTMKSILTDNSKYLEIVNRPVFAEGADSLPITLDIVVNGIKQVLKI